MDNYLNQANSAEIRVQRVSFKKNLEEQLEYNKAEVNRLTELLALMESNPDTARMMELLHQSASNRVNY